MHEINLVHEYYPNIQFAGSSSCQGFVFERATGKLYSIGWVDGKEISNHVTYNFAFGSGMMHALTALDFGRTAKKAVEAACMRDSASGGTIHVFKLDDFRIEGAAPPPPLEPGQGILIQGEDSASHKAK